MKNFIKGFKFRGFWDKHLWPILQKGIAAMLVSLLAKISGEKIKPVAA